MTNNGIVNIHGKDYMTVARRIELAHTNKANSLEAVETEVLSHDPVVIRALVRFQNGRMFSGISSVNLESQRAIEKQNPYEVAETSAVGRALGFAGFGLLESIASADEMVRATSVKHISAQTSGRQMGLTQGRQAIRADALGEKWGSQSAPKKCVVCRAPAAEKKGTTKSGKAYHAVFCSSEDKTHTQWL